VATDGRESGPARATTGRFSLGVAGALSLLATTGCLVGPNSYTDKRPGEKGHIGVWIRHCDVNWRVKYLQVDGFSRN